MPILTCLQERIEFTFRRLTFSRAEQADDISGKRKAAHCNAIRQTRIANCDTTGIVRIRCHHGHGDSEKEAEEERRVREEERRLLQNEIEENSRLIMNIRKISALIEKTASMKLEGNAAEMTKTFLDF